MKPWQHIYLWVTFCLCLASCARPVLIVETSSSDLTLDLDAYAQMHPKMEIAYDFWSAEGVPFISFYNTTNQTILLDLNESKLLHEGDNVGQSFEQEIRLQTDFGSYTEIYPDLVFKRIDRKLYLLLEPRIWASIYGPSCYSPKGLRRGEDVRFTFTFQDEGQSETVEHRFDVTAIKRISRKEISSYERIEAGPNQYFVDQQVDVDMNTTSTIIDILVSILFAII